MATLAQLKEQLGSKPVTGYAPPKQNILQKGVSAVGNIAKDALNTLIVTPATRIAQAGLAVARPFTSPQTQQKIDTALATPQTNLGVTVQPQKSGLAGVEQIGGQALKSASYLYGGEGLGALTETPSIGQGIIQGTKLGGIAGTAGGAGNVMEQGGNFGQVASGALEGGLIGAGTGGILGGITAAVHPIFSRTTPIMNPADLELNKAESGVNVAREGVNQATIANPNSFMTQDQQMSLDQSQNDISQTDQNVNLARQNIKPTLSAEENIKQAQEARQQTTTGAVKGVNDIKSGVQSTAKTLGTNFGEGAQRLEETNPDLKLILSAKQITDLNALKEGKNFNLPGYLDQETNPALGVNNGSKFGNIKLSPDNLAQLNAADNSGQVALTHTQAQDLLRELNGSTYKEIGGQLQVDNQRIGITNEIKDAASKAYGREWDKIYSDYSKGINAVNDLKKEINLGRNIPLDKTLSRISKLGETPEGKAILQQYLDNTLKETGLDLSNPVKAIHQVMDSQTTLEGANAQLKDAQQAYSDALKEVEKTQKVAQSNLDSTQKEISSVNQKKLSSVQSEANAKLNNAQKTLQQVHEEIAAKIAKGGYLKQVGTALKNPNFVARRIGYAAATVVGVGVAATAFHKALGNAYRAITGQ